MSRCGRERFSLPVGFCQPELGRSRRGCRSACGLERLTSGRGLFREHELLKFERWLCCGDEIRRIEGQRPLDRFVTSHDDERQILPLICLVIPERLGHVGAGHPLRVLGRGAAANRPRGRVSLFETVAATVQSASLPAAFSGTNVSALSL